MRMLAGISLVLWLLASSALLEWRRAAQSGIPVTVRITVALAGASFAALAFWVIVRG